MAYSPCTAPPAVRPFVALQPYQGRSATWGLSPQHLYGNASRPNCCFRAKASTDRMDFCSDPNQLVTLGNHFSVANLKWQSTVRVCVIDTATPAMRFLQLKLLRQPIGRFQGLILLKAAAFRRAFRLPAHCGCNGTTATLHNA